jgi:hypothetical protein
MCIKEELNGEGLPFFVSVTDFGLTVIYSLESRGFVQVQKAVADVLSVMKRHNIELTLVKSDGEWSIPKAFKSMKSSPQENMTEGSMRESVDAKTLSVQSPLVYDSN